MRNTGLCGMPRVLKRRATNATCGVDKRHDGLLLTEGAVCGEGHNDGDAVRERLHYNHGVLHVGGQV